MKLDMDKRGQIRFTWKELLAVISFLLASLTHFAYTTFQLREVQGKFEQCDRNYQELKYELHQQSLLKSQK